MRNLGELVVILLGLMFNGCAGTPKLPNPEVCIRLDPPFGSDCAYMVAGPDRDMSEAEFLSIETGIIFFPEPKGYGEVRTFIEKVCAIYRDCNSEALIRRLKHLEKRFNLESEKSN